MICEKKDLTNKFPWSKYFPRRNSTISSKAVFEAIQSGNDAKTPMHCLEA